MAKEFKITQLRLADLQKELTYLKTTREREIAAMIAEARSYGDLSENSEYDAAKNEQAKLYGHSLQREVAFLTVHSMFHLLGYDHMDDDERLVMEQRQREIMEKAGILR